MSSRIASASRRLARLVLFAFGAASCGGDDVPPPPDVDAGDTDAGDAGPGDAGPLDAGPLDRTPAYLKASNTETGDLFGCSVSLSADGTRLAVGAYLEASSATGVGGNQADNGAGWSGAVYVY